MSDVRLRFAPSPTGYLHIGGLRTALYNYLYAKAKGGKFILRIEDTDRTRLVEGAIENLINALKWAGIEYDEGVFVEDGHIVERGEYGPYIQSHRLEIYKKYCDELIEKGYAYYCFCSKDRLDHLREEQRIKGQVPKYDGLCRSVSLEEARRRIANGEEYVVRLKLPYDRDLTFYDAVRGKVTINSNEIDDQVLMKSDGFPTYHLAVVVDDHLMKITHIVRGEEWLPSTPKHVYLYEAFGWDVPEFVHLPTVLNRNRKKLSKRQGDVSVGDFKNRGYLPEGLVNYLALVGWSAEDGQEILTLDEMVHKFSFERVGKSGGIFDTEKLNWVNSHYMKEYDLAHLCELSIPFMVDANLMTEEEIRNRWEWYQILIDTVREGTPKLEDIPQAVKFLFGDVEITEEDAKRELSQDHVAALLDSFIQVVGSHDEITMDVAKGLMKEVQKESGVKGKALYMPIRAAVSGNVHGPEMQNILYLLGKERLIARAEKVKKEFC